MSELYYQNLSDVYTDKQARKLMHLTYNGLRPYFNFIVKCMKKIEEKTITIEIEKVDFEEIITEELFYVRKNLIDNEKELIIDDEIIIEKYFDKKLKRFMKITGKKDLSIYKIIEKDKESFENEKDSFLNSKEVFFTKKFGHSSCLISGVYQPYNLVALKYVPFRYSEKQKITVYVRSNLYILSTMIDALKILQDTPRNYNRALLKLIENKEFVSFDNTISLNFVGDNDWLFLDDVNRNGTLEQREFVNIALTTSDYAILEGPPGSGKTTTICEIIYQAIKNGERVLLVASTHVAVDNVLEKLFDEELDVIEDIKETILPIRIGKQDNWKISDLASKYQFENFWDEDKKLLTASLEKVSLKTDAQKSFLDLLKRKDGGKFISHAFLKAANLVCGTTIGILRHPDIGNVRSKDQITQPFDMIILDEASKTTFQEFLVSALTAKKFIIVGDVMQLPPYVDEEGVSSNLEFFSLENSFLINLVMNLNSVVNRNLPRRCLVIENSKGSLKKYKLLDDYYDCPTCILHEEEHPDLKELWGASIIVGSKKAIEKHQKILPISLHLIFNPHSNLMEKLSTKESYLSKFHFKHNYFCKRFEGNNYRLNFQDESWEYSIGWRLNRSFEHRFLDENIYDKQIEERMPKWLNEDEIRTLRHFIDDLKKIAFPSIIELLQNGFKSRFSREKSILNDGFNENDLRLRHRILLYQHRMHPDISSFSRSKFYNNNALLDYPGMNEERKHNISRYQKHMCWLDIRVPKNYKHRSRNQNKYEIFGIIQEIDYLKKWMQNNPKKDGSNWSIAILPFYKNQENLLRAHLQKKFKSKRYRTFVDSRNNCKIELCVIDRFQGHEADFVFLSLVQNTRIGFLDSPNRLNVALTRGKYQTIVVGDNAYFASKGHRSDLLRDLARETKKIRLLNEVH